MDGQGTGGLEGFEAPSYGRRREEKGPSASHGGGQDVVGGAVQAAAGAAVMAVGVPMLVLPGPGLAAIAGGAALASGGIKKMTGRNDAPSSPKGYVTVPPAAPEEDAQGGA